jgi:hypothetical protein
LACSAEPWMRSLSTIMASNILNAVELYMGWAQPLRDGN